jgi:hypothetical protein
VQFVVVIFLTASQFQAVLPQPASQPHGTFSDSKPGIEAFVGWLEPKIPRRMGEPLRFCVVAGEPLMTESAVATAITLSDAPIRSFEPFDASFRYISPFEQRQGIQSRSLSEALSMCKEQR